VRWGRFRERIFAVDPQLERSFRDPREEIAGTPGKAIHERRLTPSES
jgi:hypothetical protein